MRALTEATGYRPVRELTIEVPQAYRNETPPFVFAKILVDNDTNDAFRYVVSEKFVTKVTASSKHFDLLLDLDVDEADRTPEEIAEQLEVVTFLNSLLANYQMANQSRADGTAED